MDNGGDFLQLCRLCLVKDEVNIPIFEEQGDIRQIIQKISSCLPVKVSREDKLPKKICDGCSYKLDMVYEFWNTTANAEKQLLTWLGEAEMKSKLTENATSAVAQQLKPAETVVKQETIDPSDIHTEENDDDKTYMFQQKFSSEEAGPSATATSNDEPPPKRARRTAAVKAQIAMDPESDDDDDSGEPVTKVEDESEESEGEDHDASYADVPSTSADDQPGPSGVGKDGADAPSASVRKKKIKNQMFKCSVCHDIFANSEQLQRHLQNLTVLYYCTECEKYFKSSHPCNDSAKRCAFCEQIVKTTILHWCFHTHSKEDFAKTIMPRLMDAVRLTTSKEKQKAISTKGKKPRRYASTSCTTCKVKFATMAEYSRHRAKYHTIHGRNICFICGKEVVLLQAHLKRHAEELSFRCAQCEKAFNTAEKLRRHRLVHSNVFKHSCPVCNKKFKTRFAMRVHQRSHDDIKPFECVVCLKTFTTKQWRDNHLATHKINKKQ